MRVTGLAQHLYTLDSRMFTLWGGGTLCFVHKHILSSPGCVWGQFMWQINE